MESTDYLLLVTDHQTMRGDIYPLSQFCEANKDDPELCEDARCLAPGFGFTIGGGAAVFTISRWSR